MATESEGQKNRTLHFSGLPPWFREADLFDVIPVDLLPSVAVDVKGVTVVVNPQTHLCRGFGFIACADVRAAELLLQRISSSHVTFGAEGPSGEGSSAHAERRDVESDNESIGDEGMTMGRDDRVAARDSVSVAGEEPYVLSAAFAERASLARKDKASRRDPSQETKQRHASDKVSCLLCAALPIGQYRGALAIGQYRGHEYIGHTSHCIGHSFICGLGSALRQPWRCAAMGVEKRGQEQAEATVMLRQEGQRHPRVRLHQGDRAACWQLQLLSFDPKRPARGRLLMQIGDQSRPLVFLRREKPALRAQLRDRSATRTASVVT
jgi:hypothetical protein